MPTNDIKKYSARDDVITSYQEGYQIAAELQKDPAAVAALKKETERKLRNLKRAGAQSEARETLRKRLDIAGNKLPDNVTSKNDIAAMLMFVNAKTSTARGVTSTKRARAESLKDTIINAIKANPKASPELISKLEEAFEKMTPYQLGQFTKAYKSVLNAEAFDSHQQINTMAVDAMNRILNIKNKSISNIIETLTTRKEIDATQKAIMDAQMQGLNLAYNNAENVARAIRERR